MHHRLWVARRGRYSRAFGRVVLLLVILFVVPASVACGGGTKPAEDSEVLTVEQALATDPGQTVKVSGAIVATGSGGDTQVVLAEALMESYPPQAGGAVLPVTGLDLGALVGLNSSQGGADLVTVLWSDYWLVLEGTVNDGVLEVQHAPRVVEATFEDLRLRFSPVSEPLTAGTTVWWAFDITNNGSEPVDLVFSSGQRADVVLSRKGVEEYRWSDGKAFTEAIETVMLATGEVLPIVMNDAFSADSGDYDLVATITAVVGTEGTGQPLPDLTTAATVF